jgi:uncharacterized protein (DUF1697 family)
MLVVLLKGVNVGGHRTFRPSVLAEQLTHLDAVNIGAAGTLVIRGRVTRAALRAELARHLTVTGEPAICDARDILRLRDRAPFAGVSERGDVVRFVTVLSRASRATPKLPMTFPPRGRWLMTVLGRHGRFVFGIYRRDMKVIGYLASLDRLFGVPATTRNWNTIAAIADVSARHDRASGRPRAR